MEHIQLIYTIITSILAIGAFITSIVSIKHSKNQLITSTITVNRIEWMKEIREFIGLFLEIYCSNDEKRLEKLLVVKAKIELRMRRDREYYAKLITQLNKCCNVPYNYDDYDKVIHITQYILTLVWEQMKIESEGNQRSKKADTSISLNTLRP